MIYNQRVFAYIDAANLHKGISMLDWKLDYKHFRIWLWDKYRVQKAYLFIGFIPKYKAIYRIFQNVGFVLVFKEVTYDTDKRPKGNCDGDLILKAAVDYYEKNCDSVVLVSSDGDYAGLVGFLNEKKVFCTVISPHNKCSFLLRKLNVPILYLETQRGILQKRA